jgi:hypothetical protein
VKSGAASPTFGGEAFSSMPQSIRCPTRFVA